MAALKGGAIDRFIAAPPDDKGAALIYGPDGGLVRERGEAIAKAVTPDISDPFNYIELTDIDLKGEPARLADEAAALSFMGGKRVVRLRASGDGDTIAAVKNLIDGLEGGSLKPNAVVIIEAGALAKTAKLRKMFETARNAVAIACYEDKPEDIRRLAEDMAEAEGLRFEPEALALAVSLLGEDRGISRAELNKLILYAGPKGVSRDSDIISREMVHTCLVDTLSDALDVAAQAALDGAPDRLALALHRSAAAGANAISILRALQWQVGRLSSVQELISGGMSASDAMKRARPPVFFTEQRAFAARLRKWPNPKLARAANDLLEAECAAKSTGAPQREIIERVSFRLAAMAVRH